ncbi:MAG: signal peptidase I [Vagococcus sp.]|uniref:signal peptidase I n=1 Tax=Vagococcus sp. TaxID=1933889 RepID=UPI002FCC30A1
MSKKNKKKALPKLDMNDNPVWDVITAKEVVRKNKGKKKKRKASESRIDEELQIIFDELEEKKEFEKAVKQKQKKKRSKKVEFSLFKILVIILVTLIIGIIGFISYKYDRYAVGTNSMSNEVTKGNQILYQKELPISRFNVVLVERDGQKDLLRVIGTPGDEIKMTNDVLTVNGSEFDEPYLKDNFVNFKYVEENAKKNYTTNFDSKHIVGMKKGSENIPERKYFLLGDNRQKAIDSRRVGLYDESMIKGVAVMRLTPLNNIGSIQ